MQIIIHRVNTLKALSKIPQEYGVEIDIRGYGNKLLLSHDPIVVGKEYCELNEYLASFKHNLIVFNLKEAGYEERVIELAEKHDVEKYFLLDVEFPYFYRATREKNFKKIAVRFSEAEPIEFVEAQRGSGGLPLCDWVWIDTNTRLPLDESVVERLAGFKACLVCPERWGRPFDISSYKKILKSLNYFPDAVMTSLDNCRDWL